MLPAISSLIIGMPQTKAAIDRATLNLGNLISRISNMISSTIKRRRFSTLTDQEIIALAISSEEKDAQIYRKYAGYLREVYPASSELFATLAEKQDQHRRKLIELYQHRFGDIIPLIQHENIAGFYNRKPTWVIENLGLERIREEAIDMNTTAQAFYLKAASRSADAKTRNLLGDFASAKATQIVTVSRLQEQHLSEEARESEDETSQKQFVLTWVQPGVAGLMDGSVSTLAPIFATAFATQDTWTTFLVGLAASVGAGISMGFTEAASDDGKISGRGSPIKRGIASGVMTTVGGLGHALPYLIPDFWTATSLAIVLVFVELWAIAWIQNKFMDTPFFKAAYQVVLGGALVFAAGALIGTA